MVTRHTIHKGEVIECKYGEYVKLEDFRYMEKAYHKVRHVLDKITKHQKEKKKNANSILSSNLQ